MNLESAVRALAASGTLRVGINLGNPVIAQPDAAGEGPQRTRPGPRVRGCLYPHCVGESGLGATALRERGHAEVTVAA